MSLFDFFRNLFGKEEFGEEEISFSEIESWLDKKKEYVARNEDEIFSSIEERIDNFEDYLEDKIKELENFDVDKKKAKDRLKTLTEEGKKKYVRDLKRLIDNLDNLERRGFKGMAKEITKIFNKFNKRSRKNYEKATILIGDEVGDIKDEIRRLSIDLKDIFKNNGGVGELSNKISLVEKKLDKFGEIEGEIGRLEKEISGLEEEIEEKEDKIEGKEVDIEKVKESEEYKDKIEKKNKIDKIANEIESGIFDLKGIIDFRELGDFYHSFSKKIGIVKDYKKNFKEKFKKSPERLIELLEEADMYGQSIKNKIKKIEKNQ